MKKWYTLLAAAAMVLCMSVPAFAADLSKEEKQEYRQEIADTRAELKETNEQLKTVKLSSATLSAQWKTMKTNRKNGDKAYTKEEWSELKALANEIKEIRGKLKETAGQASALRKEAKTALQGKDLETGLEKLNQAEGLKKERLKLYTQINSLLTQITEMEPSR